MLTQTARSYHYSVRQDEDRFYVLRDEMEIVGDYYFSADTAQERADELEAVEAAQ